MNSIPSSKGKIKKQKRIGEPTVVKLEDYQGAELDARVEMIRALIPLGLAHIYEELGREVCELAGKRYARKAGKKSAHRHGSNPGSVRLAGRRVPIRVPRIRDEEGEVGLETYRLFQSQDGRADKTLFRRVLLGISGRNYEEAAEAVPGAIGLSSSTVSRTFIEQSAERLKELQDRDLSAEDYIVLFVDGKSFQEDEMVVALGVTMDGRKQIMGFEQCATENRQVITLFLKRLVDRGLKTDEGLLVVMDGSKGFRAAVRDVFCRRNKQAMVQRCQWHKRENVLRYLPKSEQTYWRKRLQAAYQRPTYQEARAALEQLLEELREINLSAARSLEEGLEETLTLHRLGVFTLVGNSLKTTNCLESIFSMAEEWTGRVDWWKNSSQKHRWLAAALLNIEPRLRRIQGYKHLPKLRAALQRELGIAVDKRKRQAEARERRAA